MRECKHHLLFIDCDRFTMIWNALEHFKQDLDQEAVDMINDIQKDLEDDIV